MNPEIKKQWIENLRSGEYKQGKGYLHKFECFCAIGVLCDMYSKANKTDWQFNYGGHYSIAGSWKFMVQEIMHWAGIAAEGELPIITKVVNMNDKEGKTFAELADYIELSKL